MSGTFILTVVIVVTVYLVKHAITEGRRTEQNKKFMRDLDEFDKKYKIK